MTRPALDLARAPVIAAACALAAVVSAAACEGRVAHEFGGYAYDEAGDCLEKPGLIDVVDGPAPVPCTTVRCWRAPDGTAYITDTACDAPPDYENQTDAATGPCVKALKAYAEDGHGRCPRAPDGGAGGADAGGGDGGT